MENADGLLEALQDYIGHLQERISYLESLGAEPEDIDDIAEGYRECRQWR